MRTHFSKLPALILIFAMTTAVQARGVQDTGGSASIPKLLTLFFELQDLPGGNVAGSVWEVSYQWRMADQQDFDQWSENGENPSEKARLGILLNKQSFTHRNLSNAENRRFDISIPVRGNLLARLRNAGQRRQVFWLDATVRIHDAKLGIDVVKNVAPVWGPRFYLNGIASVRMELSSDGKLRWFTTDAPPWADKQRQGRKTRIPVP